MKPADPKAMSIPQLLTYLTPELGVPVLKPSGQRTRAFHLSCPHEYRPQPGLLPSCSFCVCCCGRSDVLLLTLWGQGSRLCFSEVKAMPFPGTSPGSTQCPGFSESSHFLLPNLPYPILCVTFILFRGGRTWWSRAAQMLCPGSRERSQGKRHLSKICRLPRPTSSNQAPPASNNAVKPETYQRRVC